MENYPNCPKCNSEYTYEDGSLFVCPECAHEWSKESQAAAEEENVIEDEAPLTLRSFTTVTASPSFNIFPLTSLITFSSSAAADGHDIECKIDGFGAMKLKSSVVKKA